MLKKILLLKITSDETDDFIVDVILYFTFSAIMGYLISTTSEVISFKEIVIFALITIIVSLPIRTVKRWLKSKIDMDSVPFLKPKNTFQKKAIRNYNEDVLSLIIIALFLFINYCVNKVFMNIDFS